MTTRTHNLFNRSFALTAAALLLGTGSAFATTDAQDQARSLLTGAAGEHVSFPVSRVTTRVDPQAQAQWLLAGKPQSIVGVVSKELQTAQAGGASASDFARWLLAGKGS